MNIVYIKFQFPKRKGKEDKLQDTVSNKEGPFGHLLSHLCALEGEAGERE